MIGITSFIIARGSLLLIDRTQLRRRRERLLLNVASFAKLIRRLLKGKGRVQRCGQRDIGHHRLREVNHLSRENLNAKIELQAWLSSRQRSFSIRLITSDVNHHTSVLNIKGSFPSSEDRPLSDLVKTNDRNSLMSLFSLISRRREKQIGEHPYRMLVTSWSVTSDNVRGANQ